MKISIVITVINIDEYLFKSIDLLDEYLIKEVIVCIPSIFSSDDIEHLKMDISKYKNIVVLELEDDNLNKGRNKAIDILTGEYIIFLNSNQIINLETIEEFDNYLDDDLDVIMYDYKKINLYRNLNENYVDLNQREEIISISRYINAQTYNSIEFYKNVINKSIMFENLHTYIFKKSIISNNKIYFDEILHYDFNSFLIKNFLVSKKIKYNNKDLSSTYLYSDNFLDEIYSKYSGMDYDVQKLKSTINAIKDIENTEFYKYSLKYIVIFIYNIIINMEKNKDPYDVYILKKFINNDLKTSVDCKLNIDLDLLVNSPNLYDRNIYNNECKFFNNKEYSSIRSLTKLSTKINKNKKIDEEDLINLKQIVFSSNYFVKYLCYDNLCKYIEMNNFNKYIFEIDKHINELINELIYRIDKNIMKYSSYEEKFKDILFNLER